MLFLIPVINRAGPEKLYPVIEEKSDIYTILKLSQYGLSDEVFRLALAGRQKLETAGQLKNPAILTIVDFSQSSKQKRMYVIDILNQRLLFNTLVAHGRNTGEEFAQHFSNVSGTLKSSLGFFVTKNHVMGATVGLSLIIQGVEKGFNDNAISRQIIMHGAGYATEDFIRKTGRLGRSYGCPSLPPDLIKPVIDIIENGSCLFIYYPDPDYLKKSTLLS
ncbi:MAG: murein L,D-transpeptidase catalytic domain family protein [Bacteroidales bacterium]|nr:murein L,D-transpeptidase catalytic domain family protein [Bacteroidales bacterium]